MPSKNNYRRRAIPKESKKGAENGDMKEIDEKGNQGKEMGRDFKV